MVLKINGIDLMSLNSNLKIAMNGLEFELNDMEGEETGRSENGVLNRVKIAEAHTITITLTPMQPQDLVNLIQECRKMFVTIEFSDPFQGLGTTTAEFYNSSRNVKIVSFDRSSNQTRYESVTLKFIGRGTPIGGGNNW